MSRIISFLRPEHQNTVCKLSVPPGEDIAAHVRRLENLGYQIIDVSPPIDWQGPPQNPRLPEMR